jgi:hypothetical protein
VLSKTITVHMVIIANTLMKNKLLQITMKITEKKEETSKNKRFATTFKKENVVMEIAVDFYTETIIKIK